MSATFHGRDLFAPVAARLAGGEALADAGAPLDPGELVGSSCRGRAGRTARWSPTPWSIDGFGNVQLDAAPGDLGGAPRAHGRGGRRPLGPLPAHLRRRRAGRAAALRGRRGQLALAVNGGARPPSSAASSPATRSAWPRRDRARPPAPAPARDRLDQRARPRARRGGRAARHARHARGADARAAAARAVAGRRRPGPRCCARWSAGATTSCCRCAPGLAVAERRRAATRWSSGPTTCCSTAARSPASWSRGGRRTAGRWSGSASTSRSTWRRSGRS